MYDRILLPTDGSRGTNRAIEEAIGLAAETGAELHVLFVVEELPYALEMVDDSVEARLRELGASAIEEIHERAEAAGVDLQTTIEEGAPHRTILAHADSIDADLIVMGTHGRSGLDRYLLGSVTERVVRASKRPVLTVRVGGEE